jgi:acyl-CoA synthetase
MTSNGFYLTGDQIVRTADGFVQVVGRLKDQIIRGGFNIDPSEIEAALQRHPAIVQAAVVAVPERKLGEQACAICRIRPGFSRIELPELLEHLAQLGISKRKWPEHLIIVDSMMLLPIGKIDKKSMAIGAAKEIAARTAADNPPPKSSQANRS